MVMFLIWKLCLPTVSRKKVSICACVSGDRKPVYWNYQPSYLDRLFYSFLDLTRCIALLSLLFHLKENPINYFELPDTIISRNTNQPRIKCDVDKEEDFHEIENKSMLFEIKLGQFTTGTTKDLVKSMALLINSFYVFNVEHSSKIENTLTFIQKVFLNINDKS